MSTYTTQLGTIVSQPTQHIEGLTLDQRIEAGRQHLFDFDYPMFDERYKAVFERHFIENFWDREIGFETEFLFKRRLKNWLNLNMGYWSKMYESELLKFDPFINSKVDVTSNKENDQNSNSNRNFGENTSKDTTDNTITDGQTSSTTDKDVIGNTTNNTDTNVDGTDSKTIDGTVDGTSHNSSVTNMTGNVSGISDGTSNTTETEDTTENQTGSQDTDKFNRRLHTDTPDERLSLTVDANTGVISGDGTGNVNYASEITENKDVESTTTSQDTNTNETGTTDVTTHDETSTDSTQDSTTTDDGTTGEISNSKESGTHNETTGTVQTGSHSEGTDITQSGTNDETVDRTIGEIGNRTFDDSMDGTINSVEDFVQHRVGKIGVQTYSKMLNEFRTTFLRIEVDIFDEMSGRLFMLVY